MNINGKDGPTLKKIFTCEGCKYLSDSVSIYYKKPHKCYHPNIFNSKSFNNMNGDIDINMITPDFCPFLIKEMRFEKLNELKKC